MISVSDIFSNDRIILSGNTDYSMVASFSAQVQELLHREHPASQAIILLCSTGGPHTTGHALYDLFRLAQDVLDLTLVGTGSIESAALTASMAFPIERRFATRDTSFLIHQSQNDGQYDYRGWLGGRKEVFKEIDASMQYEEYENERTCRILAEGTGHTVDLIRSLMQPLTTLRGQEAVDFGLIAGLL